MKISDFFASLGAAHVAVGGIALCVALLYFFLARKRFSLFLPSVLTAALSAAISSLITVGLCRLKTIYLSARGIDISVRFCIAYALPLFAVCERLLLPKLSDRGDLSPSLCVCPLAAAILRVACVVAGCCGGLLNLAEIGLCAICFFLTCKGRLGDFLFFAIYFFYRFAIEFFKPTYAYETLGIFSAFQIYCLIALALSVGGLLYERRKTGKRFPQRRVADDVPGGRKSAGSR